MTHRLTWTLVALSVLAAACSADRPSTSQAPALPQLAFAANLTGECPPDASGACWPNLEIYTAYADGSGLTRLTNDVAYDAFPAWSPDGRRIAFVSRRDGDYAIYVMNADGSSVTRLTGPALMPAWSPDGKRIAFISNREGSYAVYTISDDGSDQVNLTGNAAQYAYGYGNLIVDHLPNPWSPDGHRIAFERSGANDPGSYFSEIWVMNADGTGQHRLAGGVGTPAELCGWSPDGSRLLFLQFDQESAARLYTVNADGSSLLQLTGELAQDHVPGFGAWSPDGARIAYAAESADEDVIHVMNADGSGQSALTAGRPCDGLYGISWSPDSDRIAFTRGCSDIRVEVWTMKADGSGQTRVAGDAFGPYEGVRAAMTPVWSPVP